MAERIDLNLMQVFDALMRECSVSRAAELLGIGQPVTSAALSRRRVLFGDKLSVRGLGTMMPTNRAVAAYPARRDSLQQISRAISPADRFDPGVDLRFRFMERDPALGQPGRLPWDLSRPWRRTGYQCAPGFLFVGAPTPCG